MEENVVVAKDGTILRRVIQVIDNIYGNGGCSSVSALELIFLVSLTLFVWATLGLMVGLVLFLFIGIGGNSALGLLFYTIIGMVIIVGGIRLGRWLKNTTIQIE